MKTVLAVSALATVLAFAATDVYAMAWGEGPKRPRGGNYDETTGQYSSVPEPSTLYAVGAGLALMGGAGWYIRRRK